VHVAKLVEMLYTQAFSDQVLGAEGFYRSEVSPVKLLRVLTHPKR
jgi:hypothetical protein